MTDSFNQPGFLNFVVANYSGARPWIADFSGLPIETQEWSGQRFVKAWISGQPVQSSVSVSLSGVALNVSGNVVYFTSGQNAVQDSGQVVYLVSGFNPVQNSGQVVYLASGFNEIAGSFTANVSGQPVNVSGNAVRISGSAVLISGQTVQIAGGINVSGSPVRISGETIYPVSGKSLTYGYDASGDIWNPIAVDTSGGVRLKVAISGDTVQIAGGVSVSGNAVRISGETVQIAGGINVSGSPVRISGETVYLVSGQNNVQISGQTVVVPSTSVSGNVIVVPSTSISGNVVQISGQTVYPVSGLAFNKAFDPSGVTWNDVWVQQSGGHRVLVSISGETILASVSGNMVSISGQPVSVSGNVVTVSGNIVNTSGQVAIVSGQPVNVSGNIVYLTSGQAPVFNYGFIDASGQWTQLRVTQSGQGISGIPHKLPVTFSGDSIIGSVSGNMVSISGQPVSVSGNMVSVSGQAVSISGQTVVTSVSGIALNISGNVVYLVSGQNPVQLYGFDPSGVALRPLIVNASGSNILRVDAGSIQVSANVSGNVVYLTSGQNNVQMSGQLVAVSGLVATSVSGNVVYAVSGQNPVFNYGFIDASGQWTQLRVTQSGQNISGIPHKFVVTFSGDSIIGSVSGNMVSISGQVVTVSGNIVNTSGQVAIISGQPVLVSGQTVSVSGIVGTSVSGNMVSVSGQVVNVSGNVVNTSGNAFVEFGTVLRVNSSGTICTSLSGGTELHSGIVFSVNLRNLSGNAPIYVGGTGGNSPFSGFGMLLFSNESQEYRVDNFNRIRVFATTSGQRIRAIAVGQN